MKLTIKSQLFKHTVIMTAVNLIMRSAGVAFNAYLTRKIGSAGIGLFQLVMSVYSLAVTFSCAGIRLAGTRITVEASALGKTDIRKSLRICLAFAAICGSFFGILLFSLSGIIGSVCLSNVQTASSLRILAVSLPFVAMSSAFGGYFTATGLIPQYSFVQMLEQASKIGIVVFLTDKLSTRGTAYACMAIVAGMTASEIISFLLSSALNAVTSPQKSDKPPAKLFRLLRIAIPDAAGACTRSILLTAEHLLIPRGFEKSGSDCAEALAAYGRIHAMAMPVMLYPSAVISSLSALLVPELARLGEIGDRAAINASVKRNLKRTIVFSSVCAVIFGIFAPSISKAVYKTVEAAEYIRILSPLIPVMYTDMITDGMLKGLDQQFYSMKYNIIDSALCVILVIALLPKYAVKGYILILYASELINFYLSLGRLLTVCEIKIFTRFRAFSKLQASRNTPVRLKICSNARPEYEYQIYRDRAKHSQAP